MKAILVTACGCVQRMEIRGDEREIRIPIFSTRPMLDLREFIPPTATPPTPTAHLRVFEFYAMTSGKGDEREMMFREVVP
jgi:hypothetical protein